MKAKQEPDFTQFARHAKLTREQSRAFEDSLSPAFALTIAGPVDGSVGAAHSGGEPDLPPGTPWPMHHADPGIPLHFLFQLDLAALPDSPARADLPPRGVLSFFLDRASLDLGGFRAP
jgi:uncharacterized protein YwqG